MIQPTAATLTLTVPAAPAVGAAVSQRDVGTSSGVALLPLVDMDRVNRAINRARLTVSGANRLEELTRKNLSDALALVNLGKAVRENT